MSLIRVLKKDLGPRRSSDSMMCDEGFELYPLSLGHFAESDAASSFKRWIFFVFYVGNKNYRKSCYLQNFIQVNIHMILGQEERSVS